MFKGSKKIFIGVNSKYILYSVFIIAEIIYLHQYFFERITPDFTDYLSPWINHIRQHGPFKAFEFEFSNYAPLYLHLLALFAAIFNRNVVVIKLISILFEALLAFGVFKMIKLFRKNSEKALMLSFLILLIPTVLINTAWWGQCDVIYVSLIVLSVFMLIKEKLWQSFLLLALAFAFKLQTVFIFPLYFLCCMPKPKTFIYFFLIPLVYLLTIIPSLLAGRTLESLLNIYVQQAGGKDPIVINAITLYALFDEPEKYHNFFSQYGRWFSLGVVTVYVTCVYLKSKAVLLQPTQILANALFISLAVPYFLPHMHERYFMLAEVFSVIYIFVFRRHYFLPFIIIYASLQCYLNYFIGFKILEPAHLSFLILCCLIALWVNNLRELHFGFNLPPQNP